MNIHRAFKSRLGRKLILYFLITGFAPLLIFIYFITGEYKSGILENISKDFKKNTIIISSKIFEDILERKNELKFIASTFQLKSLSGASETALIKKTIDESLVEFFKFSNLTVFDFKTKKILYSTKKDTQPLNIKENLFKENSLLFINHKNGDIKSSGQNTSGTEFPDIYLSFPITKKNEVSIILIGELNKNYLWEVTQSLYHIGNSNMAIFDENNKVLIHTFENHSFIDALNSARFFKEEKNSEVFIEHNEVLGEIFFCYYKIYMKGQFGCGNWTVISTKKSEEALDSINNLIHTVYISASVSILLLLLISLILTRQISDPVSLLVEGSKEISEGNMNFRITLKKTNDEIGELLGAFDIMTNNLRETTVSKNYLSNILNSINDFIIVINENYQIESVNDGILALGYIPSSLERKNIEILFEKSDFVVVKNKLYNFLAHKKIEEINSNLIGADGQKIPVEIQFTFFAPKKESIEKIIIICRDLREKIKLADEKNFLLKNLQESYKNLNNTQNQLIQSEKMAAIGTLTAGITHEINTPVTYINWNLKTLKRYFSALSEYIFKTNNLKSAEKTSTGSRDIIEIPNVELIISEIKKIIDEIQDGAEKISLIVKNLKDYSHPGLEKIKETDINELFDKVINIIEKNIKNNISIEKNLIDIPKINSNPQLLSQVFMNILLNGIQSIEKNDGIIRIDGEYDKTAKLISVSISDNGSGISEENLSKIFDPFFTTKDVGSGLGLGLSIAYKIMQNLKGDIKVESELNRGSKFTLIIPKN